MTFMRNAALRACADLSAPLATARVKGYGIRVKSADRLLPDDDIDLVLNLTVPNAHFEVSMAALAAGKHVFTEKPLATTAAKGRRLVAEAAWRGLSFRSAPEPSWAPPDGTRGS